jgi:hypothetical protein
MLMGSLVRGYCVTELAPFINPPADRGVDVTCCDIEKAIIGRFFRPASICTQILMVMVSS